MGEAARLRSEGSAAAANGIEEIAWGMHSHLDREIMRARLAGDGGTGISELVAVAGAVIAVLSRTPRADEIESIVKGGLGPKVRIDRADLTETLGALAENASHQARTRVEITCTRLGDEVSIRVRDDGPGVAAQHLNSLPNRGIRLDQRPGGAGWAWRSPRTSAVRPDAHSGCGISSLDSRRN